MPEQFLVLCGQIVGNMQAGFEVVYDWDGDVHEDRKSAIASGLKSRGSDDFSIGVIRDGRLASLDWMDEPKDEDPGNLRDIEDQIGWEDPRNTFAVRQEADALQQDGGETDFEWVRRLREHFADATAAARARREALEEAAGLVEPVGERPCDCERNRCGCGNPGDTAQVVDWDTAKDAASAIRALAATPPEARQTEANP